MEQALLIIGASIFGLLGTLHLLYTFFTNKFEAYDSAITESMKKTSLILTKETTIWEGNIRTGIVILQSSTYPQLAWL